MFDFYFTGVDVKSPIADFLLEQPGTCLLLSQLNERTNINRWIERLKENPSHLKLFIDSGAFSAWTKGKKIDVDEYIDFINKNKEYLTVCASVDTIPGAPRSSVLPSEEEIKVSAEGTWQNFLYMRSKMDDVDKLLYTFHAGEPWEFLERALTYKDERGPINYIAFGGLVGKSGDIITKFCNKAFEIVYKHNRQDIKIHAFGMTRLNVLQEYPFTSCDSTSWLQHANYGAIAFGPTLISVSERQNLQDRNYANRNKAMQEDLLKEINRRGFTLEELQEDGYKRALYNVMNFYEWSTQYKCTYKLRTKPSLF